MSARRLAAPTLPAWLESMLPGGTRRYSIDAAGRRMAIMEVGAGDPVLLVHGNPTWSFLYRRVAEELRTAGMRLIMPDLIGLGLSARVASREHTLEHHAAWVAAAIDALELDRLLVVGQDWGGPISVLAADQSRARISGLVAMNTVLGPPRPGFRPTLFHRVARVPVLAPLLFRGLGFPQNVLFTAQGRRSSISGPVARAYRYPLRNRLHNQAPLALARMVPDGPEHPSVPALERCQRVWESLDAPIALVWGVQDPILGRALGRLERARPDARVVRTDAGHFLQEEVPGSIADAIRWVAAGGR